jgi:hypothetical protein
MMWTRLGTQRIITNSFISHPFFLLFMQISFCLQQQTQSINA